MESQVSINCISSRSRRNLAGFSRFRVHYHGQMTRRFQEEKKNKPQNFTIFSAYPARGQRPPHRPSAPQPLWLLLLPHLVLLVLPVLFALPLAAAPAELSVSQ